MGQPIGKFFYVFGDCVYFVTILSLVITWVGPHQMGLHGVAFLSFQDNFYATFIMESKLPMVLRVWLAGPEHVPCEILSL